MIFFWLWGEGSEIERTCISWKPNENKVLIGKDLVLEGTRLKIEDKQVPGIYI